MGFDFETSEIPYEDQERLCQNIELRALDKAETKAAINCFSVGINGNIAVGFKNNTLNVYNQNGDFLYGYSFKLYGNYFLSWEEDDVLLFLVRESVSIRLDNTGTWLEVREVSNTPENDRLSSKLIGANYASENGYIYISTNDYGWFGKLSSTKSKLIQISPDGTEKILYDVSKRYHATMVFSVICFFPIFIIVVIVFGKLLIRIAKDTPAG